MFAAQVSSGEKGGKEVEAEEELVEVEKPGVYGDVSAKLFVFVDVCVEDARVSRRAGRAFSGGKA